MSNMPKIRDEQGNTIQGRILSPEQVREISTHKDPGKDTAVLMMERAGMTQQWTASQLMRHIELGDGKLLALVAMIHGILVPPIQKVQHQVSGKVTHEHHHDVHEELIRKIDMVASNMGKGTTPRPLVRQKGGGNGRGHYQPLVRVKSPQRES